MDEPFITVLRSSEPLEVELLEQVLAQDGLTVRVLGTRDAAAVGAAPHIFELRVEVPRSQRQRAREIIDDFFDDDPAVADPESLPEELRPDPESTEEASDDQTSTPSKGQLLSPLFAAGIVLFFPGACHVYARRPLTGLIIALGEIAAFVLLFDSGWATSMAGAVLLSGMLVADLIGAQRAVRAYNRGERVTRGSQALLGVVYLAMAGTLAAVVGPRIPWNPPEPERWPGQYYRDPYDDPLGSSDWGAFAEDYEQLLERLEGLPIEPVLIERDGGRDEGSGVD